MTSARNLFCCFFASTLKTNCLDCFDCFDWFFDQVMGRVLLVTCLAFFVSFVSTQGPCVPNDVIGCLNGVPYVRETQFPCGNKLFNKPTQGCCDQAIPFNR